MIGITSYGVYLPRYRMERKVIQQNIGWFHYGSPKGEKAVQNYDEDSITMAYEAAKNCLILSDLSNVGGVYLASLSLPFSVRQNSVIVSEALNLREDIRSADFTSSLQCGTNALLSGLETVGAGNAEELVVCASDARIAKPGSDQEYKWGDGAAALCVGKDGVIAEYKGSYSIGKDFIDARMTDFENFERNWESRWVRDEGYLKIIPDAIRGLLERTRTKISDYTKICIACTDSSAIKSIAKDLQLSSDQICDNFVNVVGDTGSAMPIFMVASALEKSESGDIIMLVSFGYGAQAVAFQVTDNIENAKRKCLGVEHMISRRTPLQDYTKYLAFKGLINLDVGIRGEGVAPTALSVIYREGRSVSALEGVCCKACGMPQFPKHKVCVNPECNESGQMVPYTFADKKGEVISYTADSLASSLDPPQLYGIVDFKGGGRIMLDITDCAKESLQVGMYVEMAFRRKYIDRERGHYVYFWKAIPIYSKGE